MNRLFFNTFATSNPLKPGIITSNITRSYFLRFILFNNSSTSFSNCRYSTSFLYIFEDKETGFKIGVERYLIKGVEYPQLLNEVDGLLNKRVSK